MNRNGENDRANRGGEISVSCPSYKDFFTINYFRSPRRMRLVRRDEASLLSTFGYLPATSNNYPFSIFTSASTEQDQFMIRIHTSHTELRFTKLNYQFSLLAEIFIGKLVVKD
jgi:hypothetical protein